MLSSINRLKKSRDFKNVYRKGDRIKGLFFDFFYLEGVKDNTRVGIVINSKVAALATERNRQKRIIRAQIIKHLTTPRKSMDIVIKIKKKVSQERAEAKRELREQINKILNVR